MPENAAARIGPRSALPAPATGYEIAQVVKGPTPNDPYAPAAAGSGKANDLMQSLGIAAELIPVAVDVGKAVVEDRTKKGAQARMVGDVLDPNQSNAFIDGYEKMDGSYRGVVFGNAAQNYAKENSHLPPDEFQKGLDELQKTYVGQLIHQGQLDTFLPEALKGGEHATAIYQDAKNAAVMQERDQKVTDIHVGKVNLFLNQKAAEILGIPLSQGISSIATNPEMRARFDANEEAFRAVVAPGLRQIMEESVAEYKSLGITPRDARKNLIGVVGRLAGDIGANSLNDFAYQNDASGMSPATAFPDAMNKFSDQARAMGTQISTAMLAKQEKADKKAYEKRSADRLMTLANPATTPEMAKQIYLDTLAEPNPDADMNFKIANHAMDVFLGQGFSLKDNQAVSRNLEDGIMTGKLVGQAAYSAILGASHDLSQQTYQHLMEKAHTIAEKKGDTAKDRSWAMFQSESGVYRSSLIKTLGVTDDMGKVMLGLDYSSQVKLQNITSDGVAMWYRGIEKLAAAAPGGIEDNISGKDLKDLHDRIVELFRPNVDEIVRKADVNAGYGGPNPFAPPPKPKPPGLIDRAKAALAPAPAPTATPAPAPEATAKLPPGIPEGYKPTGKLVGGKPAWISPDGKLIEVEK